MRHKFLIPLSVAIAAVAPSQVVVASPSPAATSGASVRSAADAVVQELSYQIGTEEHLLLMKRSDAGEIYAYHRSHRSHRSHSSHSSHRSSSY